MESKYASTTPYEQRKKITEKQKNYLLRLLDEKRAAQFENDHDVDFVFCDFLGTWFPFDANPRSSMHHKEIEQTIRTRCLQPDLFILPNIDALISFIDYGRISCDRFEAAIVVGASSETELPRDFMRACNLIYDYREDPNVVPIPTEFDRTHPDYAVNVSDDWIQRYINDIVRHIKDIIVTDIQAPYCYMDIMHLDNIVYLPWIDAITDRNLKQDPMVLQILNNISRLRNIHPPFITIANQIELISKSRIWPAVVADTTLGHIAQIMEDVYEEVLLWHNAMMVRTQNFDVVDIPDYESIDSVKDNPMNAMLRMQSVYELILNYLYDHRIDDMPYRYIKKAIPISERPCSFDTANERYSPFVRKLHIIEG